VIDRKRMRRIVLWVIAADFPLLYVGAVSLGNDAMTLAAVAVMGAAAAVAAAVY